MIGIIFCGYNQEKLVARSIAPWLSFKKETGAIISACSLPFLEYKEISTKKDGTQDYLLYLEQQRSIDKVFTSPEYIKETEARQLCLDYLFSRGVKMIWMVDCDEIYTKNQILTILEVVNKDKFIAWYNISFKNYFKNMQTYFDDPFCPPRIFRCSIGEYNLLKFVDDNHVCYMDALGNLVHPKKLPHFTISKNKAWVDHYSWLDNENSRLKVEYHAKHFSNGLCSYQWKEGEGLSFNPNYYTNRGIPYPILNYSNT